MNLKSFDTLCKFGLKNYLKILSNKKLHRLNLYKNSFVDIDKTCTIKIKHKIDFNKPWAKNDPRPSYLIIRENATLEADTVDVHTGSTIAINENAVLKIGYGTKFNHNANISCFERIEIGDYVLLSENLMMRDSDNHFIYSNNHKEKDINYSKVSAPIIIEDNVLIGINVTILKGVTIGKGSVIAAGSLVTKDIPPSCLAAGVPAKVIKENITWEP